VSRAEFLSVHINFSMIHAWVSYLILFSMFVGAREIYHYQNYVIGEPSNFIKFSIEGWAVIGLIFMAVEMSIYIAYYKDIMFAFINVTVFIGIYFSLFSYSYSSMVRHTALILFIVGLSFVAITIIHSFQSVFYLKYQRYLKRLNRMKKSNNGKSAKYNKGEFKNWLSNPLIQYEHKQQVGGIGPITQI
jgi:hypothetical protein